MNNENQVPRNYKRYDEPIKRLPSQTSSKLAWCTYGGKMYGRTDSPKSTKPV